MYTIEVPFHGKTFILKVSAGLGRFGGPWSPRGSRGGGACWQISCYQEGRAGAPEHRWQHPALRLPCLDLPALPCGAGVPGGDPAAREDGAVEQDGDGLPGERAGADARDVAGQGNALACQLPQAPWVTPLTCSGPQVPHL